MSAVRKGLGELLVQGNLVTMQQIEEARKEQKNSGGRLSSALVKLGYVDDVAMAEFLGRQYGLPSIDLDQFEIDSEALKALPHDVCVKHCVVPVSKAGSTLVVAFADPSNMFVRDDLAFISKCKIEPVVAAESAIVRAIEKNYKTQAGSGLMSAASELENVEEAFNFTASLQAQAIDAPDDKDLGPIVKFVNLMLSEAIRMGASDIHIEPYEKRVRVRYRIDGLLHEKSQPPAGVAAGLASRIKIMAHLDIAERRRPQDGRIKVRAQNGGDVDLRVSVLPTLFGEKIVMRILDKSNLKLDLSKLGLDDVDLAILREKINQPQGMVLVTGPTGSGKTTTLYSALASINDPQLNICTAEDPVEFELPGINQVQVNPEINFGFAEALRAFLRQDPDIIMVGEIRDYETAEIAFKAANTGHLVLSTLHTNDAPATIARLADIGIAPYLISSTVSLVVAQRMAGRICTKCVAPQKVDKKVLIDAGVRPEEVGTFEVMRGEGCSVCNGTGIKGRIGIFEVMQMTPQLREVIMKGGSPLEIKRAAIKGGMRTLRQAAIAKLKAGVISLEEVLTTTIGDHEA